MKEKIINTRNILKIIIMVLVIFSMIKSCAKAYSFEEFVEFCQYTKNMNINSSNSTINNVRNNIATTTIDIKQFATNKGYNLDNYNSFIVGNPPAGYSIAFYATSDPVSYTINTNQQISQYGATWTRFYLASVDGGGVNVNNSPGTSTSYIGLINSNPTDNNYRNVIMQNKWNYINILSGQDFKLSTLPWYFADVFICQANSGSSIYLYHNGESVGNLQTISSTVNGGTLYQVEIIDTYSLVNNSNYSLKLYSGNDLLVSSEDFNITWQNDIEPEQPSGDTSGDVIGGYCQCGPYLVKIIDILSGDIIGQIEQNGQKISGTLEDIKNQLEENNEAVKDLTSALLGESGESGEKGFFEKMYDKLFTVSEEEVQEVIEDFKENTNIDKMGMASGEIAILNTLTGEPHDFIINWGSANYMGETIIPSGEINFSAKVREVPVLSSVIDWVRILLGFSVVSVLIMEIWFTLLKCLGVSTSIYEQQQHEIEMLEAQTEREQEKYAPKTYTTTVRAGRHTKTYQTTRQRMRR